jgi:hypothetical protein
MSSGRIKSGKVKKIAPTAVSADRYNFIQLSETEPDLGVPSSTGYVLTSDTLGNRSWVAAASTLETSPITFVGDDSTGTPVNLGETFKFKGGNNITTEVIGDELTISVSKNLDVNQLSSSDSTAIQINDAVNVSGNLTAYTVNTVGLSIYRNNISATRSDDNLVLKASASGRVYVEGDLEVSGTAYLNNVITTGTATLPTLVTNTISSDDSTTILIDDSINVTGSVKVGNTLTVSNAVINRIVTDDSSDININGAPVNFAAGGEVLYKETAYLSDLADVDIENPQLDQFLRYNGVQWVNGSGAAVSAGVGVSFYITDPTITATGANNDNEIITLQNFPGTAGEQTVSKAINNTTDILAAFVVSSALNRTAIDAGNWSFINHAYVDSSSGSTTITNYIYKAVPFVTGTVTITGTGTSRTATASAGTPFATSAIDASATNTDASYLQTPQGLYQITARTSDTVVTITTPSGYTNESAVAGTVWKKLFASTASPVINSTTTANYNTESTQPLYTITAATKLAMIVFGTTTTARTLTYVYDGPDNASLVVSPLSLLHDSLAGLQGGTVGEFYHLTQSEYTGTGTGNFVRESAPTIANPSVTGTLSVNEITSADSTAIQITDGVNISGTLNAKTLVTTNISSEDSTAVQFNDGINVIGSVRLGGLQYPTTNGELGQVLSSSGTGSVEWATLTGGGGSNVAADSVTFTGFGSNNIVISDPNISVDLAGVVIYGAVDDSQAIGSGAGTFDTWSSANYDSAFYVVGTLNNSAVEYGTASISSATNGEDAFVSSGGVVSTGDQGQLTYSAGYADPNVTIYGTGTTANNTASYLRINLGDTTTTSSTTSQAMAVVNSISVSATTVTDNVSVGDTVGITNVAKIADQITRYSNDSTVTYDSAFYFAVSKDEVSGETGTAMLSLLADDTDAYVSTHGVTTSGNPTNQVTFSAGLTDLNDDSTYETIELYATGSSNLNSLKYHRINLGPSTIESGTNPAKSFLAAEEYNNTVVNSNVQVGEMENIGLNEKVTDVFTTSSIRSAFYFAVTQEENSGEIGTAEISLLHNGTDAFVSSGNVCQSGTEDQVIFGADITNNKVRLTSTGSTNLNSVKYYRVGLGNSTTAGSSGNTATLSSTGLGSTTTVLDSWSKTSYRAARYYISANSANGEVENIEARVFHDGTVAYINTFNEIYSGNNPIITLTADISGGNVRLLASCNFNTNVKSYRIRLSDSESGSSGTYANIVGATSISSTTGETFDTFNATTYNGAHYIVSVSTGSTASVYDVFVVSDGTTASVMSNYASSDDTPHLNFTVSQAGNTVTLKAATYDGVSRTLNAYRTHLLRDNGGYRVLDSWSKTTYRGAKYYININATDTGEKQNIEVLVTHDGTTPYIVTYNPLYTGNSALMDIDVEIVSSTFNLLAKNPREKNFTVRMYRVILTDSESNSTTTYNKVVGTTSVGSSAQAIDTFTSNTVTGAHYIVTAYNATEGTAETSEVFVVTDGSDAFVSSHGLSSKNTANLTFTAAWAGGTVTLYAESSSGGTTAVNAYRTNLLRDANAGLNTIDSWSTSYRGAKYYISVKDTDTGEVSNTECLLVHDGSLAYVMPYNQLNTNSGDVPLVTLSADISGGSVRLLANAPTSVNYDVRMYRIRLSDSESANLGTYTKVLDTVTVTSSATTIDQWSSVSNDDSSNAYVACNYFVTAYNSTEGTSSAYDVYVSSEGVVAAVASSYVSSKNNEMLTFDVLHTNGVVTLSATSNSGGNTIVNAYRWQLPKPTATDPFKVLDSWNKTVYRGAKYFITVSATNLGEYNAQEVAVVHNGSDAYNTVYNLITTGDTYPEGLITISTDVSSNLVRLKAVSNGEAILKVTMVRHRTIV